MSNIVTNFIIDIVIIDVVINRDEQETTVRKKKVVETSATSRMLASVATVATIATIVTATTIVAIVAAVETGTSVRRCTCRCLPLPLLPSLRDSIANAFRAFVPTRALPRSTRRLVRARDDVVSPVSSRSPRPSRSTSRSIGQKCDRTRNFHRFVSDRSNSNSPSSGRR